MTAQPGVLPHNNAETWTPLCHYSDLVPESGIAALVDGQQIALFYLPDQNRVHAVANRDPFSGANVIARGMVGDSLGITFVASPLYKHRFCLETGQCLEDDRVSLATWPTRLENDRVLVLAGRP